MSTNANLTRDLAVQLLQHKRIPCPKCREAALLPRWPHKNQNTEFKCPACGEIYHPCKLI